MKPQNQESSHGEARLDKTSSFPDWTVAIPSVPGCSRMVLAREYIIWQEPGEGPRPSRDSGEFMQSCGQKSWMQVGQAVSHPAQVASKDLTPTGGAGLQKDPGSRARFLPKDVGWGPRREGMEEP